MVPPQARAGVAEQYDVGIVGVGHIALHYHLPVLEYIDATTVAFVADIDPTRASRAATVYDTTAHTVDDLSAIPDCDVILLATPVGIRSPYVEEFGARGTAIFAEKPFALDLETHEAFLREAEAVTCNYTRMEYGTSRQMKRLVEAGLFGELEAVRVQKGIAQRSTGKTDSQVDPETRGGQLHENGSHLLSQLTCVLPTHEFEVVDARVRWQAGIDVDVDADIRAEGPGGRIPVGFELSFVRELEPRITYEFETAEVCYDPGDPTGGLRLLPSADTAEQGYDIRRPGSAPNNHEQAILDRWLGFLSALESGTVDAPAATGIDVTGMITGIYDETGRWPGGTA